MKLREEFTKLMEKFKRGVESQSNPNLPELFKDSIQLFERLKDMLAQSNEQEKKEIIKLMAEMHDFLSRETKKLAEKTGLSEDQMLRFAENPDNFSAEQWRTLELIRARLNKTATEMAGLVKKKSLSDEPSAQKESSGESAVSQEEIKIKKPKSSKKDRWMKS
jgi:ClpP class serine protease